MKDLVMTRSQHNILTDDAELLTVL